MINSEGSDGEIESDDSSAGEHEEEKTRSLSQVRNEFENSHEYRYPDFELTDDTRISGTTWFELKSKAMEPNYMENSAFVKLLNK